MAIWGIGSLVRVSHDIAERSLRSTLAHGVNLGFSVSCSIPGACWFSIRFRVSRCSHPGTAAAGPLIVAKRQASVVGTAGVRESSLSTRRCSATATSHGCLRRRGWDSAPPKASHSPSTPTRCLAGSTSTRRSASVMRCRGCSLRIGRRLSTRLPDRPRCRRSPVGEVLGHRESVEKAHRIRVRHPTRWAVAREQPPRVAAAQSSAVPRDP